MKKINKNIFKILITGVIIFVGIIMFGFATGSEKTELSKAKIITEKKIYKSYETPKFKLYLNDKRNLGLISKVFAFEDLSIEASVLDKNKEKTSIKTSINKEEASVYSIELEPTLTVKPGKYTIQTIVKTPDGQRTLTQDFTWGVLALNPDKAVYKPGETAKIAIGVLDENGNMVCDALLRLDIKAPDGQATTLSTDNGKIKVNKECQSHEYTLNPDYETYFKFLEEGTYTLNLLATTKNGTHVVEDNIKVRNNINFDIKRTSATRIYPLNKYPMIIDITANEDYKGIVQEDVPLGFAIIKTKQDKKDTDYAARILEKADKRVLQWNVDWKKGEKHKLSYVFDTPDISPEFYLLGPLRFQTSLLALTSFEETRKWQLANDAVGTVRPDGDVTGTFATCTTNGNGNCRFGVIDEATEITGDLLRTGTAGSGGEEEENTFTSVAGTLATITSIAIKFQADVVACNGSGTNCDQLDVRIFIDGAYQTAQSQVLTTTDTLYTLTFNGTWTGDDDLQVEFVRTVVGGGAASSRDDDVRLYQVYAEVTYTAITVSGNVYNAGTTTASSVCDANAGTYELSLRTNGAAYSASCSDSDGSYSFTGVIAGAGGSGIVIWINDLGTDGAIAIRYDGAGDSTANTFYNDTVTITSDDTSGVTNAVMDTYDADGGDVDIPYVVTSNNLTASSGAELLVKIKSGVAGGSMVFDAGGIVETNTTGGDLHVDDNGLAELDTATNAIGRDVLIDSGATLRINADTTVGGGDITAAGTLTTTSGTPTVTIRGTGSISGAGTKTIYNLTIGDATVATTTLSGTLTVSNDASVGTGSTFNINANLTVTGSLTNTTTGIINHTANSPVVTVSGTSIGGGSGNITFYRLQKAGAGTTTFSGSGTNIINDTLDATAGTLTLSTNNVITVAGDVSASTSATLNQNTALTINGGDLLTAGTGVVNTTAGTGTVTINGTGGTIGGGGTVTIYNLVLGGSGTQTLGSDTTSSTDVSVPAGKTLELNSKNLTVNGGDFTTTTTGSITCSGCSAGTVTMSSTGSLGGGSGAITFYNLTTSGTGTTTFSGGGTNSVLNNVSVGTGTTLNINSSVSVAGNFNNTTTGIIGTTVGTPTLTMTGTTKTLGGGSGAITFYALATSGTASVTFSGTGTNAVNNNVSVGSGTTLNINASVTITGNITNTTTGIIGTTVGTPTVTVNGSTIGGGSGAITFYNLTAGIAGTVTFSGAGTNTINNDFTVNAGTTLSVNNSVSIGGNFVNTSTGIITYSGTPTVTMTGTSKNLGGGAGAVTLYNLTVSGSTSVASAITVNNDMTNNGATSGSVNVTVNGNVVGTGSMNMSSGTFKQRVATGKNFGTTSSASTWAFSTLTLSNSSGSPITITTQSGGSGTITASALNIGEGGDASTTTLNASSRSWIISGTGTPVTLSASSGVTASTSTFTYTGTGSVTLGNFSYYSLATNNTGTYSPAASPLTVTNNITVTLGTLSLGTSDLNVGSSAVTNSGGISVAGTLSQSASGTVTVVSSSAGTATIGGAGTLTFYNLTFAPAVASAPTFTLGSAASQTITIDNDLTIGNGTNPVIVTANTNNPVIDVNGSLSIAASGTFTAPPSALFTIAKNMTNNGTFNNNSGTVTFDTANTSVFNGSATPAITFFNFTSNIPGKILEFTSGKTFRVDGLFNVNGASGNQIHIHSTTASSQWFINHQGTESVTYAHIHDSGCDGSSTQVTLATNSSDGGNNGTCWVFQIGKAIKGNTKIKGNVRFR